jgi:hypothetical protein
MDRRKYRPLLRLSFLALSVALAGCAVPRGNAPSKYEVFFSPGSLELSPSNRSSVDHAAAAIKAQHPKYVVIGAGGTTKGEALSDPRFNIVRDTLIADGVDTASIRQADLPDGKMTGNGNSDLRVEIRLVWD